MPAIVLDRVSRIYGKDVRAVSDLTLEIPDGSFTTLLGPSGCGKTTTLRMIAGLDMPTMGTIRIGDKLAFSIEEGQNLAPAKRGLGLVFQSYALWPHLTVAQNISFGLEVQKVGKAEAAQRLDQVATALQIDGLLGRYTSELSGGQQQRVAIARVLVMQPSVLLLDEPLSNLDATLRMDMRAELKRLHFETGATIIYVTHDQLEALTMSTHIALMQGGKLQQFAPPLDVYSHPANKFAGRQDRKWPDPMRWSRCGPSVRHRSSGKFRSDAWLAGGRNPLAQRTEIRVCACACHGGFADGV
jgi:iron(III) transport system ATP-binding protein